MTAPRLLHREPKQRHRRATLRKVRLPLAGMLYVRAMQPVLRRQVVSVNWMRMGGRRSL